MARKVYVTNYSKLSITLTHAGVSANVTFNNGRMGEGIKAKFITSDPFLQYLIEHDSRYGHLFSLWRTYQDDPKEKTVEEKKQVKAVEGVRDLADAIDYLAGLGKQAKTRKQVLAVSSELGIAFPNLKD
jgi:uncharacterized membrane protein YkgB